MSAKPFCPCHMCQTSRRFRWEKEHRRSKREAERREEEAVLKYVSRAWAQMMAGLAGRTSTVAGGEG